VKFEKGDFVAKMFRSQSILLPFQVKAAFQRSSCRLLQRWLSPTVCSDPKMLMASRDSR
jgi:hypothetical protein